MPERSPIAFFRTSFLLAPLLAAACAGSSPSTTGSNAAGGAGSGTGGSVGTGGTTAGTGGNGTGGTHRRHGRQRDGGSDGGAGRVADGGVDRGAMGGMMRGPVTAATGTTLVKVNTSVHAPALRGLGHQPLLVGQPRRRLGGGQAQRAGRQPGRCHQRPRLQRLPLQHRRRRQPHAHPHGAVQEHPRVRAVERHLGLDRRRQPAGDPAADRHQRRHRRDPRGVLQLAALLDDQQRLRLGRDQRLQQQPARRLVQRLRRLPDRGRQALPRHLGHHLPHARAAQRAQRHLVGRQRRPRGLPLRRSASADHSESGGRVAGQPRA